MNSLISPFNADNQLSAPSEAPEPSAAPSTPPDSLTPELSTQLWQLCSLIHIFWIEIGYLIGLSNVLAC